jgi:tripartite ATP-independent transporter DctM subunit
MDTITLATIVLLGGFVVLMCLRVPISFALLLSTLASALVGGTNLTTMIRQMVDGVSNFSLLAIPFFILMGEIMGAGGISEKIVDLANLLVGRFRGGLAYVNCLDSMFFGGISGSAVADVSSLGSVVIPMMKKQGYTPEFSVALTVTTSCQGVLIPPSHNMIIYALAASGLPIATGFANVNVEHLLMAGAIPGVMLGLSLMLLCFFMAGRYNFPRGFTIPRDQRLKVMVNAILPMLTLVIIMGGVAAGIFTVTESSAFACLYTFILTYLVFRSAKLRDIGKVLKNTLRTLAVVLTLIGTAKAFAYMMTDLRIPDKLTALLLSITDNRYLLLLIINALLLLLGCVMDMAPLIMIMTPILLPVVTDPRIGMDPIHFGVMLIFNLAVGLCTPPVGSALFVGCAVGKTTLEKTAKAALPMFAMMVIVLMLVTYIPDITMWLPGVLFGK